MCHHLLHIDVVRLFQLMLGCTECRRLGATLGFAAGWEENAANKPSTCVRVCVCVCVCVCVRAVRCARVVDQLTRETNCTQVRTRRCR